MVDKVKPLKLETSIDGTEVDPFPREADPIEDFLAAKGLAFENSDINTVKLDTYQNVIAPSYAGLFMHLTRIAPTRIFQIPTDYQMNLFFSLIIEQDAVVIIDSDAEIVIFS